MNPITVTQEDIDSDTIDILKQYLVQLLVEYRFLLIFHVIMNRRIKSTENQTLGELIDKFCLSVKRDCNTLFRLPVSTSRPPNDVDPALPYHAARYSLGEAFGEYNPRIYRIPLSLAKINQYLRDVIDDSLELQEHMETYHQHLMNIECVSQTLFDELGRPGALNSVWDARNYSIFLITSTLYVSIIDKDYKIYHTDTRINGRRYYSSHIFTMLSTDHLQSIGVQISLSELFQNVCEKSNHRLSIKLFEKIFADNVNSNITYFWAPAWPKMSGILRAKFGFAAFETKVREKNYVYNSVYDEYNSESENETDKIEWIKYSTRNGFIKIDMKTYLEQFGDPELNGGNIVSNFNDPYLSSLIIEKSDTNFKANQTVVEILKDYYNLSVRNFEEPYIITYFKKIPHPLG